MSKQLPSELVPFVLPFNWDVTRVWALTAAVEYRPIAEFRAYFDLPFWSSRANAGMLFDLTPNQVLKHPERYPHQQARLEQADLEYPVDFIVDNQQFYILDGLHRMTRLRQLGHHAFALRCHTMSVRPMIEVP